MDQNDTIIELMNKNIKLERRIEELETEKFVLEQQLANYKRSCETYVSEVEYMKKL